MATFLKITLLAILMQNALTIDLDDHSDEHCDADAVSAFPAHQSSFHDPIYDRPLRLDGVLKAIVDSEQFQRLQHIRQQALVPKVYTSAKHTRFEHSIGTCYLAGLYIKHLRKTLPQCEKHLISDREVKAVEIAGLCHDIGHGPFSHLFEDVVRAKGNEIWTHEGASEEILRRIVYDNPEVRATFAEYPILARTDKQIDEFLHLVTCIIDGRCEDNIFKEKPFLLEIVANKRNGFDVDKIDYLRRDYYYTRGITGVIDYQRIVRHSWLIKDEHGIYQLAYRDKIASEVLNVFEWRYKLHRDACLHPTVTIFEHMMIDTFIAAEELLAEKLSETCGVEMEPHWLANFGVDKKSVDILLRLDDEIVTSLIRLAPHDHPAARLFRRLETRHLYQKLNTMTIRNPNISTSELKTKFHELASKNDIDRTKYDFVITPFKFGSEKKASAKSFRMFGKEDGKMHTPSHDDLFHQVFSKLREAYNYSTAYVYWRVDVDDPQLQTIVEVSNEFAQQVAGVHFETS